MADRLVTELKALFPGSAETGMDSTISSELFPNEHLIWQGGPERWGLLRMTPYLVVIVVLFALLGYAAHGRGLTMWQYLLWMMSSIQGPIEPMLGIGAVGLAAALGFSLRDPRRRWSYVATDQRLMTFYRGRKLRQVTPAGVDRLRTLPSLELRLRGLGDVVWAVYRGESGGGGGPDQGKHGFLGVKDPDAWCRRIAAWADLLRSQAASSSDTVASKIEDVDRGRTVEGLRTLRNIRYGFRITVPDDWPGEVALVERKPIRLLGVSLPVKRETKTNCRPVAQAEDDWNLLTLSKSGGLSLQLEARSAKPQSSQQGLNPMLRSRALESNDDLHCGPFRGHSVDYKLANRLAVRWVELAGTDCHLELKASMEPEQMVLHRRALDAIVGSIDAV